uniref:CD276 antigen-like isoform X2 n=1 Tax=Pristiophorus japonicus TaxID=55135 RepID=UPI00398F5B15
MRSLLAVLLAIEFRFALALFKVHTPKVPVTAVHGQYTVLRCSFTTLGESSLQMLIISWQRAETEELVYSYYYGKEQLSRQSPQYSGRTSLFPEEFKRGNASVKLDQVRPEDAGQYKCFVSNAQGSGEGIVSLIFAEWKTEVLTRNRWIIAGVLVAAEFIIILILIVAVCQKRASLENGIKQDGLSIT